MLFVVCLLPVQISALEITSTASRTLVVELYTSEGCSSCPPADKWLSSLKSDSRLFKTLLPLAFHVDYWDQLGWPDPYARAAYSERQRELVRQGLLSQVYTPGLVVNSREWRGWFNGQSLPKQSLSEPGILRAELNNNKLSIYFDSDETLTAHIAFLGMGLSSEVEAGENRGRSLVHDFVVLDKRAFDGQGEWQLVLDERPAAEQQEMALAVWVTKPGSLSVIQAAGGYLE
jgi:hypothetical protein